MLYSLVFGHLTQYGRWATQPCPCGYYNHPDQECVCAPGMVQKYLNRISGPLLDRIDIHVEVVPVPVDVLSDNRPSEKSKVTRERVIAARKIQEARFAESETTHCNAQMSSKQLRSLCQLNKSGQQLLKNAINKLNLSARAYDRIIKVSRTIADLDNSTDILTEHLAEAIHYRSFDRESWGN